MSLLAQDNKKRKSNTDSTNLSVDKVEELFVDAPADNSEESDGDSTDSDESVYSGLDEEEEEEDSSDEESRDGDVSSVEEGSDDDEPEDGGSMDVDNQSDEEKRNSEINAKNNVTSLTKKKFTKKTFTKKTLTKTLTKKEQMKSPQGVAEESVSPLSNGGDAVDAVIDTSKLVPAGPVDEYEYDSSDEEDIRTTVGNIPIEWYREFEHLGYDWEGKKIGKPKAGDKLDEFLNKMENPNYWRTVLDKTTGQNVVLTDEDVETIERFRKGKNLNPNHNPYEPWIDFFTHETMIHPVTNRPEHKRSFVPSHLDRLKVGRMVHAIKMGWMKPTQPRKEEDDDPVFFNIWEKDDEQSNTLRRHASHIPAPKMALPGHSESYNPPPEYLLNEQEIAAWKEKEPEERKLNFIPQTYKHLRNVPAYKFFVNERFQRCLDLYLCPRQRKMRMNVNPEDLLPKLPKPRDLQPYPTTQAIEYKGHEGMVRGISVDPTGQWLVSGCEDKTVRFWEVSSGRCMRTVKLEGVVRCVAWNPSKSLCIAAAVVENTVHIINPRLGDKLVISNTDNMINAYEATEEVNKLPVEWEAHTGHLLDEGLLLKITQAHKVDQVTWHSRGDYLAVVMPQGGAQAVLIHQLSKRRSQNPFKKSKGLVQRVLFHPTRPFLFMATQRYIRVYNLLKQELTKKLLAGCNWVSSMAVHPGGDNLIIGSYDCRTSWFDLDLSNKPYHTLRHHKKAVRQVSYHASYPLFASASDDGTAIVCHGRVFNDLLQNPLIVPVKVLRGHTITRNLGVLDLVFHPTQPWLFTAGADSSIRLFT